MNTNLPKRYLTVRQIPEMYPCFSTSSIRWLIFNEKENGFSQCIRRIGRKILIDLDEFEQWIDCQENNGSYIKNKSIHELQLTTRSFCCLKAEGIEYIRQLLKYTQGELCKIPNFGRKSLHEIKMVLKKRNLFLKND